MAGYKVSYKVLKQQGDELKAAAKLLDGYAEKVSQISGKLGDDAMLAEVRKNLGKLHEQLGESRAILNTAGEFLNKSVESYTGAEIRQVKKVDGTKAHSRDFYKNPVVVASAGGAAAGGAAAGVAATSAGGVGGSAGAATPVSSTSAPPVTTTTSTESNTVTYTDNSVNITYATPAPDAAAVPAGITAAPSAAAQPVAAAQPTPMTAPVNPPAAKAPPTGGIPTAAKVAAGVAGGGAAAAGAVFGGIKLKKHLDGKPSSDSAEGGGDAAPDDAYDPEAELEKAIQKVHELEEQ